MNYSTVMHSTSIGSTCSEVSDDGIFLGLLLTGVKEMRLPPLAEVVLVGVAVLGVFFTAIVVTVLGVFFTAIGVAVLGVFLTAIGVVVLGVFFTAIGVAVLGAFFTAIGAAVLGVVAVFELGAFLTAIGLALTPKNFSIPPPFFLDEVVWAEGALELPGVFLVAIGVTLALPGVFLTSIGVDIFFLCSSSVSLTANLPIPCGSGTTVVTGVAGVTGFANILALSSSVNILVNLVMSEAGLGGWFLAPTVGLSGRDTPPSSWSTDCLTGGSRR